MTKNKSGKRNHFYLPEKPLSYWAEKPLAELEKVCKETIERDIAEQQSNTQNKVSSVLNEGVFMNAAIELKASAIWELIKFRHIDLVHKEKEFFKTLIFLEFGNKPVSIMETLEVVNSTVYKMHLRLLDLGCSYPHVCQHYAKEKPVQEELLTIAAKVPDMKAIIEDVVGKMDSLTSEVLVETLAEQIIVMYAANHIIEQATKTTN